MHAGFKTVLSWQLRSSASTLKIRSLHFRSLVHASMLRHDPANSATFEIIKEDKVYQRYFTLYDRRIRFPSSKERPAEEHDFDVIGHPQASFHFSAVFPFHPANDEAPAEVTILKEFCQGPNQMMYSLPAGSFDAQRHGDYAGCARAELWEEAQLEGGEWVDLLGLGHPGIAEVKWCANRFTPFLCIAPHAAATAGKQDAEEFIEIHRMSIASLREVMRSGNMLLPSVTTAFMAIEELQRRGFSV